MVSCQPSFQSYKIALKTCDQSVIEHNLVTIYLNLEWPDNISDNPNLLIHIFDKKYAPKLCKNEYLPQNFPLPFHHQSSVTSVAQPIESYSLQTAPVTNNPNPPSIYRPSSSSLITNASPSSTTNIPTGDHNDVSSTTATTTTTTIYNSLPSSISPRTIPTLKINPTTSTTTTTNTYRHQTSPPCSSSNQGYFHIEGDNQASPTLKTMSPISSTNIPNQVTTPAMTHVMDIRQNPSNNNSNATSSSFKAFLCSDMKTHLNAEQTTCPVGIPPNVTNSNILCRPVNHHHHHHRSLAQRAAVASQIRSNRSVSMTPMKEQGQTTTNTFFPLTTNTVITNQTSTPAATTIATCNSPTIGKKSFNRQRSLATTNNRTRKRRISKQMSLPTDRSASTNLYQQPIDVQSSPTKNLCSIKEEQRSPGNTIVKSPRKLFSPFSAHSMQTTVSNSEIDQTIEEVISGKGEIVIHDNNQTYTSTSAASITPLPPQPSSQLVWVQNGAVTTKTWLSPLYQKQTITPTSLFDPQTSTLTHQDVVNIAQQVVFPSVNETNKVNNVALSTNNSKRRNRSKSTSSTTTTTTTPTKRNRQRKGPNIVASNSPQQTTITPTLNLISKPVLPTSSAMSTTTTTTTIHSSDTLSSSMTLEKNDLWQNVDTMLDDFHLVAIDDQQRLSNLHSHFDFDLSIDRFPSSTPPPPPPSLSTSAAMALPMSSSMEKSLHSQHHFTGHPHQGKLTGADVDVYEHFLNPLPVTSTAVWQENQVTSSVSTPPDFQSNLFAQTSQTTQQQYFTSISDENFHSQVRLLFDVQS